MNKDKIKAIELKKFRGATKPLRLDFRPEKSMILIFGENGTGKSTIIDALDFVFNRECGSLKEKSSTNIKSHLPALGSKPANVEVMVETQKGRTWKGRLNGSKPEIEGNNNILLVGVLRRSKILKLIDAIPSERYKVLKSFIKLPNIRYSEKSLRDLISEIKKDLNKNTSNRITQEDTLKNSWEKEGKNGESFLSWAEEISEKESKELNEKIKKLEQFIELIKKPVECWKEAKDLREKYARSKKEFNRAEKVLKDLSGKKQLQEVIDILQKTQSFLQKEKTAEECPACEQPIVSENLRKRISERLHNMKALVEAKEQYQNANRDYDFAQKKLFEKEKELRQSTEKLIKHSEKKTDIKESKQIKENCKQNNFLNKESIDAEKAEIFFEDAESLLQEANKTCENSRKISHQLNLIKTSYLSFKETENKINKLDRKEKFLSKVLQIVENERKSYVEGLLRQISEDIEKLYSKLHPKEGLGNIELSLKPNARSSLEITSNFQSEEAVPPQAYFSESHLDTLGICVFIAVAKHFKNDIIVLDDIVTSLDQQHLDRFIKMLHNESQNFNQTILTTHYRPWRERYKFSRQPSSNIQLIELSAFWSLDKGIKSSQTKLSIEELEALKKQNPFDRQAAGSKAGVFLESLLDSLSLLYELHAPRRPEPKYTLGELMSCFSKKFISKMKIVYNDQEKPLSEIINKLFETAEPIRNQVGSHFNISGMNISDKEIMPFLDRAIELGKALICSQCGELPQKNRNDCWTCGCAKTKLYPLRK